MANITKDNFIVVYRLGDSDSKNLAMYYASKHSMDIENEIINPSIPDPSASSISETGPGWQVDGQLLGIACSNNEILNDEPEFNEEVLNPIQNALKNSSLNNRVIWGVVLGYNIPGGFYDIYNPSASYFNPSGEYPIFSEKIISSTSRVSRGVIRRDKQYQYFDNKFPNKLYKRDIFKRFDSDDAEFNLIVSRIDAPTLALAKQYIDQAENVNQQVYVAGTFYIDPYSDRAGALASNYTNSILDFYTNVLPELNIEVWSTTFMDPYIDVAIPSVEQDSFVWSWFTNRASNDFFKSTSSVRAFFYNADYDGAETIRDINGRTWPILSLNNGYACCAGSMDDPGVDGFLDPSTFYKALSQGATIGEAYYFSLPYLDWTVTLFGDPLVWIDFPKGNVILPEDEIEEDESWYLMSRDLGRVAANLYEVENELEELRDLVVNSNIRSFEIAMLLPAQRLYEANTEEVWHGEMTSVTEAFFHFPEIRNRYSGLSIQFPTIDNYLTEKNIKVSELLTDVARGDIISVTNILDEGWWEFEYIVQDDAINFVNYHFELNVYDEDDVLVVSTDSYNINGWIYEAERDNFVPMTSMGVSASLLGRRVRYRSRKDTSLVTYNEYLTRGKTYTFSIRQYSTSTTPVAYYKWRSSTDIIYS